MSKNLHPRYSASMTGIEISMPESYPSVCFCQNSIIHYHSAECQIAYITDSTLEDAFHRRQRGPDEKVNIPNSIAICA